MRGKDIFSWPSFIDLIQTMKRLNTYGSGGDSEDEFVE